MIAFILSSRLSRRCFFIIECEIRKEIYLWSRIAEGVAEFDVYDEGWNSEACVFATGC